MRVTDAWITSFKSVGPEPLHLSFPSLGLPTSIIGYNNAGKSNVLSALLHALLVKSTHPTAFTHEDFFGKDISNDIEILVRIDPPLLSADAFNNVKTMRFIELQVAFEDPGYTVSHHFLDEDRKQIYNARTLKRSKTKTYSADEKDALQELQRSGSETAYKWKSKVPAYFITPEHLARELRPNRFSLLGRVIDDLRVEFQSDGELMVDAPGVVSDHVGKPRHQVYRRAIDYLERHVLPTEGYKSLVGRIEDVLRNQLHIADEAFQIYFSPPSAQHFFQSMAFAVKDSALSPRLPIERLGTGFQSLFVIALLRALVRSDEGEKIFLIEEPETFLHEHYQEYFYEVLCEIAQNNQVIYTTHSKKFVNVFAPASILRLHNRTPKGTALISAPNTEIDFPDQLDGYPVESPADFARYLRTLEPNLGNIVFARRVVVVEGPHDLLAYKTVLETRFKLNLDNTALVAAWGKDPIPTIVSLCRAYGIDVFVIHDSDLLDPALEAFVATDDPLPQTLPAPQKAEITKNRRIHRATGGSNLHRNQPNLEGVLGITAGEKSASAVYVRVHGLSVDQINDRYPGFIPQELLAFLGTPAKHAERATVIEARGPAA